MDKLKLVLCIAVPLIVWLMPSAWIPLQSVSLVEQRLIAIFVMALLFWVFEPIPIFATSVLVILLELLLISDKSFKWMRLAEGEAIPNLMSYKAIMGTFASPIIMLFLGGFFLAMAAKKYRLDQNLARVLLRPFGTNPAFVLLGLMVITAIFSMFMSNTATTAMMLAILMPVLDVFDRDDPGRAAFALAIPFAANIGGLGTPIGTPPNAVAMKYLTDDNAISFGKWMLFAVPYVIVMLLFTWFLLSRFHRTKQRELKLKIEGKFLRNPKAYLVYAVFAMTILLWLTGDLTGLNSYVIALIPVGVFCATGVITSEDLKKISWDVLWLVSGGIALGIALEQTGLSQNFVTSIQFELFPPIVVLLAAMLICIAMATFMSNTATANLMLPLIAALALNLPSLAEFGGSKMFIVAAAFSCSLAMCLPVSTPPNAMAYASGLIKTNDMIKMGLIIGLVGMAGTIGMLFILYRVGFL